MSYIHMLGSLHIKYFTQQNRNLYKCSQQGWESLNEKFKLIFFNHSQHGGNYGQNVAKNDRSYLKTSCMAFQRERSISLTPWMTDCYKVIILLKNTKLPLKLLRHIQNKFLVLLAEPIKKHG